jgi:phage tail-like protein
MSKSVLGQLVSRTGVVIAALAAASALPLSASAQTVPIITTAPRFVLSVGHADMGTFSELAGIQADIEPAEYISAFSDSLIQTRQFGKTTPPTVILKRPYEPSKALWQWHEAVMLGEPDARKDSDLSIQDDAGNTLLQYVLHEAWPAKLEISGVKAGVSEVAYETLTLKADSIEAR